MLHTKTKTSRAANPDNFEEQDNDDVSINYQIYPDISFEIDSEGNNNVIVVNDTNDPSEDVFIEIENLK